MLHHVVPDSGAGPAEPRLYRPDGGAGCFGRLLVAETVNVDHDQDGALVDGEGKNASLYLGAQLSGLRLPLR